MWSQEAREAALAARQANAKGSGGMAAHQTGVLNALGLAAIANGSHRASNMGAGETHVSLKEYLSDKRYR